MTIAVLGVVSTSTALAEEKPDVVGKYYDPVSGQFITLDQLNSQPTRELLLEVRVGSLILGELVSQEIEGKLWTSLNELVGLLDFPVNITVNPDKSIEAQGWYIRESNLFSLIPNSESSPSPVDSLSYQLQTNQLNKLVSNSKTINHEAYFPLVEMLSWFDIKSVVDVSGLMLSLKPSEPLPIEEKKLRQSRKTVSLVSDFDAQYPREDVEYRAFSPILTDIQLNALRDGDGSKSYSTSVLGSGDLAYMTGRYYLNHSYRERTGNSDVNASLFLERNSINSDLLGPLKATHFSVGDYRNASIANLPSSNAFGVRASNRPYGRITNLSTTDIRGLQQPGWDVELYLNGIFIGSQTIGDDGQYNFIQQPLQVGENRFTLKFFGLQGQREELEELYVLDPAAAVGGKLIYDVSIGKQNFQLSDLFENDEAPNEDYYRVNLHLEKGLSQNLSVTGDYSQYHFSDGELHHFIQPGLRYFWNKTLFSASHLQDLDAGSQTTLDASRGIGSGGRHVLNYSFLTRTEDFATDVGDVSSVRSAHSIGLNGQLLVAGLNYRVGASLNDFFDDSSSQSYFVNLGKRFGRLNLNHNLIYSRTQLANNTSSSSTLGRLNAGINWYKVFFRGGFDYTVDADNDLNSGYLEAQWNISNNLRTKLRYNYNALTDTSSQGISVNWSHSKFVTSFLVDQADNNWRGQINLHFSLGHNPLTSSLFMTGSRLSNSGAVAAQVFEDLNNNQIQDENEPAIENAEVVAVQQHRRAPTDKKGVALLTGLRGMQVTDIEVTPGSLEDPFWIVSKEGVSFLPRPGLVKTLLIPVVTAGEVEGTVRSAFDLFKSPYEQGRVPLIMTNIDNNKTIETESSFDGFFLFDKVPPGNYTLQVLPTFLESKKLETRLPMSIKVGHQGSLILGANFTLYPKGMFDYSAATSEASGQDKQAYNIDLGEFLSEENARVVLGALRDVFPNILSKLDNSPSYEMLMIKKSNAQYKLVLGPIFDLNDIKYICGSLAAENLKCQPQKVSIQPAGAVTEAINISDKPEPLAKSVLPKTAEVNQPDTVNPEAFTLQIMNTSNKFGLENYIEENQLKNARILEVVQNNETRFILTVGTFLNRETAKQVAAKIEKDLNINPWVRTFESINAKK